ncbi:amidohydrolase family protein [Adhaeribacter pallidiroseus]|uniref:N-acetylglucosamine-6-phosphate deacetylase n=1 Tax=Adhaeribacter pallidiroseus TaxID=2072847 RepID=A0A369QE72_9BACT|nr:amidohydrolase family protein [Adhaeribacter pallidiroseus]RDC62722.1 N-acetylglucosamine-6-phosphate deacetylase [Adhaeribacter pallidiroseus]
MRKITYVFLLAAGIVLNVQAQETFPRNGVSDERAGLVAFTNATIFVDYQTRLDKATFIIRNGKVEAVGTNVNIPAGAHVVNTQGKFIYPSFIDLFSSYGMPAVTPVNVTYSSPPQAESNRKGAYNWNQAIRPETNAAELFKVDAKVAEDYRNQGFGTLVTQHPDGIARGTAALVTVAPKRENEVVLHDKVAAGLSFNRGSSTQDYPNSLMGAIALIRQTYLDAEWYRRNPNQEQNLSLQAFTANQKLPHIFEVQDKLNQLRADKIGDEFGQQYILKGRGDEYQMIREIKATNAPLIVPVNFPEAYNVEDPMDADRVAMEDLKHWEMAPANAAVLFKNKVAFAFTAANLKDKKRFLANVRKALAYGLPEKEALKALTETPARLLQIQNQVGALRRGMIANFIITAQPIFQAGNAILENWIQGERYLVRTLPTDVRGVYTLQVGPQAPVRLEITGQPEKPDARLIFKNSSEKDTTKIKARLTLTNDFITLAYSPDSKNPESVIRLSGWYGSGRNNFQGSRQLADAAPVKWSATLITSFEKPGPLATGTQVSPAAPVGALVYPFTVFGRTTLPKAEVVLIKNTTVWTNESEGRLENADVLLRNGKIEKVGKNLASNGAKVIDGTNKHLTPGIIDEHSHIAISHSVNEGTQSVTAEVRIGDVIDPEDINIYRQLAGGVVAAQLLHGSANPIGGQSALIKLRWGLGPEDLKIKGADHYIKFALGENVKHSNRSPQHNVRFPQTRMGVEQVYVDAFQRAKEYDLAWQNFKKLSRSAQMKVGTPRRDLELEALVEILNKQRFITCHSYVQSEINMLLKVADQMGFQVNTFTHILEGYKVADKMKQHGSGASTFSDWWAYKMEVKDAIPYNAALMTNVGLVTAINSDDAEMARRLNQEAAKTVKYGGLSEEEALKLVTLNPAKLLHLDARMGSLKPGKDADVVLWTDHPLSIYAKAEKTFVDGILYFDLATDQQLRQERDKERQRLIQKMLAAKQSGEPTQPVPLSQKGAVKHCEDVVAE